MVFCRGQTGVCGGTHRFDGCEILKNTEFLRGHYIRYCQQARRDTASRATSFPGTNGEIPTQHARVNAIGLVYPAPSDHDDYDDGRDFQNARR